MINLIACVTKYKDSLAIGRNNKLLFHLREDMKFFKNLTINNEKRDVKFFERLTIDIDTDYHKNVVLMGRKTYFSIPENNRPLKDRINIVLTRDPKLLKQNPIPKSLKLTKDLYFTDIDTFERVYKKRRLNVFVIGGSEIYKLFMHRYDKLYITEVKDLKGKDIKFEVDQEPDTFIDYPSSEFKLSGVSEKQIENKFSYRFLYYTKADKMTQEYNYLNMMNQILLGGNQRSDRTQTGTISMFGTQMKFDISESIPMLTTKRVPFKTIVEELLFFCRGDTDAKILQKKGIKIWNGNTTRDFLDKRGLTHYEEGIMGPMYGYSWSHFGAKYSQSYADTSTLNPALIGGVNQLQNVIHLLKTDPFSRRIIISAWDPIQMDAMVLNPCHILVQFYVTEENNQKYLSCQFYMRSSDQLAWSFNCVSYSILTYILAEKCGMKPKELIYTAGDTHIYMNHIDGVKEQLKRVPRPFPKLILNDSIKKKDWSNMTVDDFELIGYFPHPSIKMDMAI